MRLLNGIAVLVVIVIAAIGEIDAAPTTGSGAIEIRSHKKNNVRKGGRSRQMVEWEKEHVDRLYELCTTTPYSHKQLAAIMEAEFGRPFPSHTILAKRYRMGLRVGHKHRRLQHAIDQKTETKPDWPESPDSEQSGVKMLTEVDDSPLIGAESEQTESDKEYSSLLESLDMPPTDYSNNSLFALQPQTSVESVTNERAIFQQRPPSPDDAMSSFDRDALMVLSDEFGAFLLDDPTQQ